MSCDISGVSRSGRVRKKSAKLKEMEELEKTDANGFAPKSESDNLNCNTNYTNTDFETVKPIKKKLKIKFSLDDGGIEEVPIDNTIDESDINSSYKIETLPSLKIKIFQNSLDNYSTSPNKEKKVSPKKLYESDNTANLIFQQITSGSVNNSDQSNEEDNDSSFVVSDSNESLQAAIEHAKNIKTTKRNTEIKSEPKNVSKLKKFDLKSFDKEKKQKSSKITAYTLFAKENRHRIQQSYPNLDFANVSKRLGEVWQTLPQREKMQWKRKAQKQKGFNTLSTFNINQSSQNLNVSKNIVQKPNKILFNRTKPQEVNVNLYSKTEIYTDEAIKIYLEEQHKPLSTNPVDLASYFKVLGSSLNLISNKLNELNNLDENNALDLLLDSTICALCPLLCLTNIIPETNGCDEIVQKNILNNVAFLMPGI